MEYTTRKATCPDVSGDRGVGEGDCLVRDESRHVGASVRFLPIFPASCACGGFFFGYKSLTHHHAFVGPWVTSVGSTTGDNPEIAAKISGGGFSNYFLRPS